MEAVKYTAFDMEGGEEADYWLRGQRVSPSSSGFRVLGQTWARVGKKV